MHGGPRLGEAERILLSLIASAGLLDELRRVTTCQGQKTIQCDPTWTLIPGQTCCKKERDDGWFALKAAAVA